MGALFATTSDSRELAFFFGALAALAVAWGAYALAVDVWKDWRGWRRASLGCLVAVFTLAGIALGVEWGLGADWSASGASSASDNSHCDPNYRGACLDPNASDYDCAGGSGDGPLYTGPVQVVGDDHFGLDRDGDGYGCE